MDVVYLHHHNFKPMIVYTLTLKKAGEFDGLFYQTKSQFGTFEKLFTRKQMSSHLNRAIKTAKNNFDDAEVKITTYQVVSKDSFSVTSLTEFKTFENRMNKIEELLNSD
jgi:hypothetical protein